MHGAATEEERASACGTRVPAEELLPEDAGWGGEQGVCVAYKGDGVGDLRGWGCFCGAGGS